MECKTKTRFTDSQILAILKQAETGTPVPELCRWHNYRAAVLNERWNRSLNGKENRFQSDVTMARNTPDMNFKNGRRNINVIQPGKS
nr:transposase [Xenorhabdus bovienii]